MRPNIRSSLPVAYLYIEKILINTSKNYVIVYVYIEEIGYDSLQWSYIWHSMWDSMLNLMIYFYERDEFRLSKNRLDFRLLLDQ